MYKNTFSSRDAKLEKLNTLCSNHGVPPHVACFEFYVYEKMLKKYNLPFAVKISRPESVFAISKAFDLFFHCIRRKSLIKIYFVKN